MRRVDIEEKRRAKTQDSRALPGQNGLPARCCWKDNIITEAQLHPCRAGAYAAELISEAERFDLVRHACPGPGACGGMYTANTMASAIEALGMSLPYSSSTPAVDPLKALECRRAGL